MTTCLGSKSSAVSQRTSSQNSTKKMFFSPSITKMLTRGYVAKNNKTNFFHVLYYYKTWVFDQSECVQGTIYILNSYIQNK